MMTDSGMASMCLIIRKFSWDFHWNLWVMNGVPMRCCGVFVGNHGVYMESLEKCVVFPCIAMEAPKVQKV